MKKLPFALFSLALAACLPAHSAEGPGSKKAREMLALCTQQGEMISAPYQIVLWKEAGANPEYTASARVLRLGSSAAEVLSLEPTSLRHQFTVKGSSIELTMKTEPVTKPGQDPYHPASLSLVDKEGNYEVMGMSMACFEADESGLAAMLSDLKQK